MADISPVKTSYTIWFSQRTGSTLLCQALKSTGTAGIPAEWLEDRLWTASTDPAAFLQDLWKRGSTPNGVFGLKTSYYEPSISRFLAFLAPLAEGSQNGTRSGGALWETAFPGSRHIFMTRRNKVRLAVSWWKAIQSGEWHRPQQDQAATLPPQVSEDAYSFDAIHHLLVESVFREAGIQAFFTEAGIQPLTIVYEDFIADYEGTVNRVLDFIGVGKSSGDIAPPPLVKMADELSESWVQRYRREQQAGWKNLGW
jgi:LPS sulfotransferase NodH